jgi:hypothetical protein
MRGDALVVKKFIERPLAGELKWIQPHALKRYHELRIDGALFATLRWKKMFGSLAVAEFHEGRYTFKRVGFFRPCITVRREDSAFNMAVLRFISGSVIRNAVLGLSGTLEFESGEGFSFNRLSYWNSRWAFSDRDGNLIVTFDRTVKGKPRGTVTVNRDFADEPLLRILVVLGWYAIILDYEEKEAAIGTNLEQPSGGP